jgi:hypothetical protein
MVITLAPVTTRKAIKMTQLNEHVNDEMVAEREPVQSPVALEAPVSPTASPANAVGHPVPPHQTGNALAVAGMVLGITSVVFCWWGLLTLAMVILALTFSSIGIHRASEGAEKKGMAIAGLACGCLGGLLYLILGVVSLGVAFFL